MKSPLAFKLLNNHKAIATDEAIPLLVFIFFSAAVYAGFLLIHSSLGEKKEKDMTQQLLGMDAEKELSILLSSPFQSETVAYSIVNFYYAENKDTPSLHQALKSYFNSRHPGGWILTVEDSSAKIVFSASPDIFLAGSIIPTFEEREEFATASLPLIGGNQGTLIIRLFLIGPYT